MKSYLPEKLCQPKYIPKTTCAAEFMFPKLFEDLGYKKQKLFRKVWENISIIIILSQL